MSAVNYDWQGLVLVTAIVGIVAFFLIPRLARQENDGRFLLKILIAGLLLKLGFGLLRYWLSFVIYGGLADVGGYHYYGIVIAQYIRILDFGEVVSFLQWGTKFIDLFTGVVYSIVGPSIYGGYLVYAFIGFLGSYFFYRAFRVAFPEGNKWLYTILIFLSPSILYWPNGIGKDALIFFCIGIFSYGSAQFIRHLRQGILPLALGLIGVLWIRPHIAAILLLAFGLAFFLPVAGKQPVRAATFIVVILVVVGFAWLILPRVASYIGVQELSPQGLLDQFQIQQGRTFQGGSAFEAIDINNPLTYPMAIITLLFRPFPWETHNLQAFVQSLEGLLVLGLFLWRIKSLGKAIAASITNSYMRYILIYSIGFIIAFSIVANFGLIARERTMFLPFFYMLIAFTPFPVHRKSVIPEVIVHNG
jgi:hypothetical protein